MAYIIKDITTDAVKTTRLLENDKQFVTISINVSWAFKSLSQLNSCNKLN